jgi:hypothetical protein
MKLLVRFYIAEEVQGAWSINYNNYTEKVIEDTEVSREDVARLCREGIWIKDTFIPPQRILKATLKLCSA